MGAGFDEVKAVYYFPVHISPSLTHMVINIRRNLYVAMSDSLLRFRYIPTISNDIAHLPLLRIT